MIWVPERSRNRANFAQGGGHAEAWKERRPGAITSCYVSCKRVPSSHSSASKVQELAFLAAQLTSGDTHVRQVTNAVTSRALDHSLQPLPLSAVDCLWNISIEPCRASRLGVGSDLSDEACRLTLSARGRRLPQITCAVSSSCTSPADGQGTSGGGSHLASS